MTIAEIDAQIAQLRARRAELIAARKAERRPLDDWITTDDHGLTRRSLSLDECRRYAVISGTKLKTILEAAERAEVPIVETGEPS